MALSLLLAAMGAVAVAQQATAPKAEDSAITPALVQVDSPAQIEALPVESSQWEDLSALSSEANPVAVRSNEDDDGSSGSARGGGADGAAATGLSFTGLPAVQDALRIDGLSGQQSFRSGPRGAAGGGATSGSSFIQGAIGSFRLLPHTFSAQYGGVAGGVLVVQSRAGDEQQVHGSWSVLSRESAWAATNPFSIETHYKDGLVTSAPVKPTGSLLQFGATVGLPVQGHFVPSRWKKKLSVFGSLELQLHDDKLISSPQVASFYALTASQIALLGNRGVNAEQTNAALNYLDSLTGTITRHATRVQSFLRVDDAWSARDHITATYNDNRADAPAGAALGQASDAVVARGRASVGDSTVHVDAGTAQWRRMISARVRNDLRGQVSHDLEYETPRAPLPQEPAIGPGGYAPQVSIAPEGFAYGTPANLGRLAYPEEWRVQLADTLELRRGKHVFTFGADWSRVRDRIASTAAPDGAFSYDSNTVAEPNGLVNWITDYTLNVGAYPNAGCSTAQGSATHYFCFNSYTQGFGPLQTEFVTHELAGFVEDSIHPLQELTLTFGVRYDYTLLPLPQTPNFLLDDDIALLALPLHGATATFPEDRNNFGPRASAAWSPGGGKLFTARIGYGAFFGRTPGATMRAALTDTALPTTTLSIRIRPKTEVNCPQVTTNNQGFGYPCAFTAAPPEAVAQTSSAMLFSSHFREPAVQRATLSLEREIGHGASIRASYAMAMATQLPTSVDLNIAPSPTLVGYTLQGGDGHPGLYTGETFYVPLYTTRLIPQYGPVMALVSSANATYHAGTIEARWRGPGSVEMRGSYTFSRAIDYAPSRSAVPGRSGQFDPYRNGYDKGLSGQQIPQRFSGEMQLPVRLQRGPQWLQGALNGWSLAAIATAGSGAPYSYEISGGQYLPGGRRSINGSGGATYLPTVGRNTLRLPAQGKVDLRAGREFKAGGRLRLNAFAQVFNLLNTENLSRLETRAFLPGNPNAAEIAGCPASTATTLVFQSAAAIACEGQNTPAFGTPTSSTTGFSTERQLEFGVRAHF